jgi:hypothetical protein
MERFSCQQEYCKDELETPHRPDILLPERLSGNRPVGMELDDDHLPKKHGAGCPACAKSHRSGLQLNFATGWTTCGTIFNVARAVQPAPKLHRSGLQRTLPQAGQPVARFIVNPTETRQSASLC